MGVIDRIGKVVRAEWTHLRGRRAGDAPGDERDDRNDRDGEPLPGVRRNGTAATRAVVDVEAALRVLELGGAPTLAEVRAQYQRLARRYHPKTQSASADDAHAARVVLEALTDALEVLEERLLPLA